MNKRTIAAAGLLAGLALTVSACSSSGGSDDATNAAGGGATTAAATTAPPSTPMATSEAAGTDAQFGAACSKVPTDPSNPGSFDAMSKVPAATAASGNPLLSTLVTAVKAAGLVDTVNNAQNITVFAPDNAAFAKIPKATLDKVLADKATLTKILTYHVIPKKLTPAEVTGTLATLEKGSIKAEGTAPDITVGPTGSEAHIVCGNVQTANATVYIIDTVMMPAS
jgi:uncharacterized surface protein with fasciclin (FAS1) repeats